ncbi:glycosyl hydrolase [Vibrio sp. TH_r3]|uniref:glycosyl hydrolase n=1 Tax=Vibrio sp. TH_r3 TaxID=3082084 RepID=UPI002954DE43|nr:glycosyl hydrolase [Vibrio sp. TH_r3]MDV7105154.1 glycosyl hydrolase [Vibrio sp. TH_r3]
MKLNLLLISTTLAIISVGCTTSPTENSYKNEHQTFLSNKESSLQTIELYEKILGLEKKTENKLLSGLFGGYSDIDKTDYGRYNGEGEFVENKNGDKVDDNEMVRIEKATGKRPIIYACDFGLGWNAYQKASDAIYSGCANDLIKKAKIGHVIQISNHLISPINTFSDNFKTAVSNEEYARIFQTGSVERERWLDILNEVANGLNKLKQAGVPVIFRPLHEMNGDWFWWGADDANGGTDIRQALYIRLYQDMHHYLSNVKGLNNLIWVYSPDRSRPGLTKYYPGDDYVDIVGLDAYFNGQDDINDLKEDYKTMVQAFNKPYALTETGPRSNWNPNGRWLPKTPFDYEHLIEEIKKDMPKTAFFITWNTGFGPAWNLKAKEAFSHPWVATLGEF